MPCPRRARTCPTTSTPRLVVLGIDYPYSKEPGSAAETVAKAMLEMRGNTPRLYRNTLVFLAADKTRLQDLDEAARRYLAWASILTEKEGLNLDPQQVKQAETQRAGAEDAVIARLPETYQWLLVPGQASPQVPVTWQALRLTGQDALAVRVSKKLRNDELLITSFAASRLLMELERVPLWRGDHVAIRQLLEDFARYIYLPRLKDSAVLLGAIEAGLGLLTWRQDSFAYAESYDEAAGRYRGLREGQRIMVNESDTGLLVRPAVASRQLEAEAVVVPPVVEPDPKPGPKPPGPTPPPSPPKTGPKRYHGAVELDPQRVGRDASRIADEVLTHLVGLVGSQVRVTLEIEVTIPGGAPDQVVRTVTENGRTLKFTDNGFESE